jgi:hypothetical protein
MHKSSHIWREKDAQKFPYLDNEFLEVDRTMQDSKKSYTSFCHL